MAGSRMSSPQAHCIPVRHTSSSRS
jgi:hypothetical protein